MQCTQRNASKIFHGQLSWTYPASKRDNSSFANYNLAVPYVTLAQRLASYMHTHQRFNLSISRLLGEGGGGDGTRRMYHKVTRDIINMAEQMQARTGRRFGFSSAKGILFIATISHTHTVLRARIYTGVHLMPSFYVQPEVNN